MNNNFGGEPLTTLVSISLFILSSIPHDFRWVEGTIAHLTELTGTTINKELISKTPTVTHANAPAYKVSYARRRYLLHPKESANVFSWIVGSATTIVLFF